MAHYEVIVGNVGKIDAAKSNANWLEDNGWGQWSPLETKREMRLCLPIEE